MEYTQKYMLWRTDLYFDSETRKQLDDIENNPSEIEDRFGKELAFGTGGLRGIMGAGTNRMNIYVVRRASHGLAETITARHAQAQGIVIGYDSRHQSALFAAEAARVFISSGIKVFLFNEPLPTPMLSFAIRYYRAAAGVMITASHNPKEYNGYKVYGEDGAQLSDTSKVAEAIAGISDIRIPLLDSDSAIKSGLIHIIGRETEDAYVSGVKALFTTGNSMNADAGRVRIVYTPLHGVGGKPVSRVLRVTGFHDLHFVESQIGPDGDFPTLDKTLNPEDEDVYEHALMLAKEKDADLIIATDPDCDRVGVMVRKAKGQYVLISGNEAGALMLDYMLQTKRCEALKDGFIAKTIVTTRLADVIAGHYGVGVEEVLTGFKYIGELIRKLHDTGEKRFIFGMEDSCGYLTGTDVRDKDGIIGCMLIAETAAWHRSNGMSLYEGLQRLHEKYGWFSGELLTYPVLGDHILSSLRQAFFSDTEGVVFKELGIIAIRNYHTQTRRDLRTGEITRLSLPESEVVYYELTDGWFCIRPSGTESKIKIYIEAVGDSNNAAREKLGKIKKRIIKVMDRYVYV